MGNSTDVEFPAALTGSGVGGWDFGHRAGGAGLSWVEGLALAVLLVLVIGFVHPAVSISPTLRAVVETVMTLLALAAAELTRQQFLQTRRLRELLLLGSLLTLALIELFGAALPAALTASSGNGFTAPSPIGQLVVSAGLALTALTPSDTLVAARRRPLVITAALSVAAFGVAEGVGLLLREALVAGAKYPGSGLERALHHPVGFLLLLVSVALLTLATTQFVRRARMEGDSVLRLLAAGVLLLAGARLYSLALPRLSLEEISVREALRLLAFAMFFAAALQRDLQTRSGLARAAALAERRRVAQDLHDGLAQDLAFIAAHGQAMAEDAGGEHPVVVAARRALALSRHTINELSDPSSTSSREALEATAHELGQRFGIRILVDVQPAAELAPDAREQAVRIAREAIANAARHGGAHNVVVSLKRTSGGESLRVSDDGSGLYGESGPAPEGFGMRSMRERAAALGGVLTVRPRASRGTELEVILP